MTKPDTLLSRHSDVICCQLFTADECARIRELASSLPQARAQPGTSRLQALFQRNCKVTFVPRNDDTKWIYERIFQAANQHNDEVWKFELNEVETLQLVSYGFLNHFALSVVVPAGFEPATIRLEGECSIQLSYGTMRQRNRPCLPQRAQSFNCKDDFYCSETSPGHDKRLALASVSSCQSGPSESCRHKTLPLPMASWAQ